MRKKKAIKNILTSLIFQIVMVIIGFVVPKMIIEKYGSNTNGIIQSITQFLSYISLFQAGFGPVVKSLLYKPLIDNDKAKINNILYAAQKFFRRIMYIFIVYILALMIFYPIISNTEFDNTYIISLILIISISTFAEYFWGLTYSLLLDADQRLYVYTYIQLGSVILNFIFTVILINCGTSIHIVKFIGGIIYAIKPLLLYSYVRKKYQISFKNVDKGYKIKQQWDGLAQHIAAVIHGNTDVVVLSIFSTMKEVSVYSVYNFVVLGLRNVVSSIINGLSSGFGDIIARKEIAKLNKSFNAYECIYHTFITIVYTCALVLIIPFESAYTYGIEDANYIRPLFGFLIVFAEFINSIKSPYSNLAISAGKFKETRNGACIEAALNLVISIILVFNFGLIGVAIGTGIAMIYRTIDFIIYDSKNILKRKKYIALVKMCVDIIEALAISLIIKKTIVINCYNYVDFIKYGIAVLAIVSIVVLMINLLFYRNDLKDIKEYFIKNGKK